MNNEEILLRSIRGSSYLSIAPCILLSAAVWFTSDSSGKTLPSFVHDMFRAHGWELFDVHGFIHTMSGTKYASSFANDGIHLNAQMNKAVVAQLALLLYNGTGPKAFNHSDVSEEPHALY